LERFVAQARARATREDVGRGVARGQGVELEGHRPYRSGEDLRDLDWELLARLGQPWVRVRRAEQGERVAIVLDTSASMGVGSPSKLQLAAEVALALTCASLAKGGSCVLLSHGEGGRVECFALRSANARAAAIAWTERRRARGSCRLAELLSDPSLRRAHRVVVLGDLMDVEPAEVLALAGRGRRVELVQVLAERELAPRATQGVEWIDPEDGASLQLEVGERVLREYGSALDARFERWRAACRGRGQVHRLARSDAAFEDVAGALRP
jgi:uncharacterized protein (DUF58 family)